MLGINYESSDEDEEIPATKPDLTNTLTNDAPTPEPLSEPVPLQQPAAATGPVNGPSQGPTVSPAPPDEATSDDAPPGSPYTSNRALVQNLTLPTVPNFDIPPSPPGSPPPRATQKFALFLDLKKNGQHFNQRLEGSSVFRDPGHLPKLMGFAGISAEEHYKSALSEEVAVPTSFPEWAYVDELRASQRQILKAKEQEKSKRPREGVVFVSANKSGTSSGTGTPAAKGPRQGVAESIMAGKRKELEHRSRDNSESRGRGSSRSPKRRR
ncbi:hypothetical protein CC86DRAFT_442342 [Ophiobolus disseminans]|uniref:HCNGP-domain-containing protein n=1 Tax=Ophiobolus disseminans TaxID=1469910 RepID=A0A6A7AGW8_9PLEO|nr:hypothetical protein CC86DRAFT_442342 [Ophiobolus disseminans]